MRKNNMRKTILTILVTIATIGITAAQNTSLGIEQARTKKLIEYKGEILSQTGTRKLKLNLKNKTRDSLTLDIETGRVFMPTDPSYQPLVVTRGKTIMLGPKENREVYVNAICGNSNKRSSLNGSTEFNKSEMAKAGLVNVLNYLVEKRLDVSTDVQHIIWSFTNDIQIASIHQSGLSQNEFDEVMQKVSSEKGVTIPWYTISYEAPPDGSSSVFTGKPEKVEGKLAYTLNTQQDIQFILRDGNGKQLRYIKYINQQNPGEYIMPVAIDAKGLPNGKYQVSIENTANEEIKVFQVSL
jgi:hypothetical protein